MTKAVFVRCLKNISDTVNVEYFRFGNELATSEL